MFKEFLAYFSHDIVWYALLVGLLISVCSALFGVILVLKRFSFIGDGLSHVAFGATAIATVLSVTDNTLVVMPITVVAAILLLRAGKNTKLKGDSAIAVVSVGALALGYLIMSIFPASSNIAGDVCSALFASSSILYLKSADVILCALMSATVITLFVIFYRKIFALSFDEDFATAVGVRTGAYNVLIATVTAVIIVMAMKLVGSLLISALIIFPALSAMRIMRSFRGVVIFSCILASVCAVAGFSCALLFDLPIGPTIAATNMAAFGISILMGKIFKR